MKTEQFFVLYEENEDAQEFLSRVREGCHRWSATDDSGTFCAEYDVDDVTIRVTLTSFGDPGSIAVSEGVYIVVLFSVLQIQQVDLGEAFRRIRSYSIPGAYKMRTEGTWCHLSFRGVDGDESQYAIDEFVFRTRLH